jgi:hypothetical protein
MALNLSGMSLPARSLTVSQASSAACWNVMRSAGTHARQLRASERQSGAVVGGFRR